MVGQTRLLPGDPLDPRTQALGDRGASTFGRCPGGAIAASKSHGGSELPRQGCDLRTSLLLAAPVMEALRLGQLVAQLFQPAPVRAFRSVVENRVPCFGRPGTSQLGLSVQDPRPLPREVENVELLAGVPQQMCQVVESPYVLQSTGDAAVDEGPVVTFVEERGNGRGLRSVGV
jgi:hypothetical protein